MDPPGIQARRVLALIPGGLPVSWPGRYLVTVEGQREVGVLEKVETPEESDGVATTLAGRFAEALWARWEATAGGASAKGANWRQAVTAALSAWHMPDLPPLKFGMGTEAATGASYSLNAKAGDSAADAVYRVCEDNGARPVVSYDRAKAPGSLDVSLVRGLDRTRGQRDAPSGCSLSAWARPTASAIPAITPWPARRSRHMPRRTTP